MLFLPAKLRFLVLFIAIIIVVIIVTIIVTIIHAIITNIITLITLILLPDIFVIGTHPSITIEDGKKSEEKIFPKRKKSVMLLLQTIGVIFRSVFRLEACRCFLPELLRSESH